MTGDNAATVIARAAFYRADFPQYPESWPTVTLTGRLYAPWRLGNNYRGSGYYGAYPPEYVARVMSMFPDKRQVLHLFSGSLPSGPYWRFDCREAPAGDDWEGYTRGDAERLTECFAPGCFDLVLADPPYSVTDAAKYGTTMPNRRQVVAEVAKVLQPGGWLVWLDVQEPMYRKADWIWRGFITVVRCTNHRVRIASLFERR